MRHRDRCTLVETHVLPQMGSLGVAAAACFADVRFQALVGPAVDHKGFGAVQHLQRGLKGGLIRHQLFVPRNKGVRPRSEAVIRVRLQLYAAGDLKCD